MDRKVKTATLSIISNTSLIIMKIVVGCISGSVSIISEAIHSTMDLLAAIIAFFSVRVSGRPPDEDHPYGHDKVENISGVIEAILIFAAAAMIIVEAIKKIIDNDPVEMLGLGVGVMLISAIVNIIVSRKLYKVAKEEESIALEADALHLKVDVWTSLGVAFGLAIIWGISFFYNDPSIYYLDPIIAILVAMFILRESYILLKTAFSPLLDVKLSDEDIEIIKLEISKHEDVFFDFHEIRTRKSGKTKHIDFHLTLPRDMTVQEAHNLCDTIEKNLEQKLTNVKILIHTEPCENNCSICKIKNNIKSCENK